MRGLLIRFILVMGLAWLPVPREAAAGIAEYTDHGRIDFDTAVQFLNPYGTWSRVDGRWAFTPLNHYTPYTHGRWLYTEFGWYWSGAEPHSWLTEHYGFWKRGGDKVWAWYPGPIWLPQTVEIRATTTHIGWRSGEVDADGNFVESADDRYAKTDEWTFVTRAQFTRPITPALVAPPAQVAQLLDDSTDSFHAYTSYRVIARPGPHPADFVALAGGNGMFPPDVATSNAGVITPALAAYVQKPVAPSPANGFSVTASTDDETNLPPDPRQVHYWTTMSLPTAWSQAPADAKPDETYVYRPDFYQDQDGIERRIGLWIDPASRKTLGQRLRDVLAAAHPASSSAGAVKSPAPVAAVGSGAFGSEFEQPYRGDGTATPAVPATPVSPAAASASNAPAPSGLAGSTKVP